MIVDRELMLTAVAGDAFVAGTTYGTTFVDMGAAGVDAAAGEDLEMFLQVTANSNVGTSLAVSLVADTDGAGTSAVALLETGVNVATHQTDYTTAKGVRSLGKVPMAKITSTLRYLSLKVVLAGSGGVSFRAWLQKANDARPNAVTNLLKYPLA